MCPRKEPAYFVEEYGWSNGEDWYLRLFSGAQDEKYLGESTTDYTKLPRFKGVPSRIRQYDPNAKFIYILRDPIERTISHYWWRVRFHGEKRPIVEAIRDEPYYRSVSNYVYQVKAYFEVFDQAQFKIITFENFISDPQAVSLSVFNWLGVDPAHLLPATDTKLKSMPEVVQQVREIDMAQRLRYSKAWALLGPRVPKFIRSLGRRIAVKEIAPKRVATNDAVKWLRGIQTSEVEELSRVVKMDFHEWRTLYAE
jgi:hypothetical protein